jgi:hypothetical protein
LFVCQKKGIIAPSGMALRVCGSGATNRPREFSLEERWPLSAHHFGDVAALRRFPKRARPVAG